MSSSAQHRGIGGRGDTPPPDPSGQRWDYRPAHHDRRKWAIVYLRLSDLAALGVLALMATTWAIIASFGPPGHLSAVIIAAELFYVVICVSPSTIAVLRDNPRRRLVIWLGVLGLLGIFPALIPAWAVAVRYRRPVLAAPPHVPLAVAQPMLMSPDLRWAAPAQQLAALKSDLAVALQPQLEAALDAIDQGVEIDGPRTPEWAYTAMDRVQSGMEVLDALLDPGGGVSSPSPTP